VSRKKSVKHQRQVTLSGRDIAFIFRDKIENRRGLLAKGLEWEFFRPDDSSDPFADLTGESVPDIYVAASYWVRDRRIGAEYRRKSTMRARMEDATSGAVFLSIWDQGETRRVEIQHQGNLSPNSKKMVRSIVDEIDQADHAN